MNIVKSVEQFDNNNIFFCEPIKNNIMNDGNFIRILYSNNYMTLNGVFIYINLNNITIEKQFNKVKCIFNVAAYKKLIEDIIPQSVTISNQPIHSSTMNETKSSFIEYKIIQNE